MPNVDKQTETDGVKSGSIKWRHPWDPDQMVSKTSNVDQSPVTTMPVFDDGPNTPGVRAAGACSSVPPATRELTQVSIGVEEPPPLKEDRMGEEYKEFLKFRAFAKANEVREGKLKEAPQNADVNRRSKKNAAKGKTVDLSSSEEHSDEIPRKRRSAKTKKKWNSSEESDANKHAKQKERNLQGY